VRQRLVPPRSLRLLPCCRGGLARSSPLRGPRRPAGPLLPNSTRGCCRHGAGGDIIYDIIAHETPVPDDSFSERGGLPGQRDSVVPWAFRCSAHTPTECSRMSEADLPLWLGIRLFSRMAFNLNSPAFHSRPHLGGMPSSCPWL
jgi:hypothetical protein